MEISIMPRWLIKYLAKDYLRQNDINILISNLVIISIFILFKNTLIDLFNLFPHFCLVDKLFGIECPFCGTTRAFCELANGNLSNAYKLNFSSFFVALFFVFQIPLRIFSLYKHKSTEQINLMSKYFGYIVLTIILVNWTVKVSIQ